MRAYGVGEGVDVWTASKSFFEVVVARSLGCMGAGVRMVRAI